jgi:hypothetical protein
MSIQDVLPWIQAAGALSFLVTAGVALKIYSMQKKDSQERSRREARIGLSQAYFRFTAETLRSKDNIDMMQELFFPQYTSPQVERIQFMYMVLNTLYMEWYFYMEKLQKGEEFHKTMNSLIVPLTRNIRESPQNSFLISDFNRIFSDFNKNFIETVQNCIRYVR